MNVGELSRILDLTVAAGSRELARPVTGGYTGDLLSDVLAGARPGSAWFTVQTHLNTVAVAVRRSLACIVVCGGYAPSPDTLERADLEGIPILTSSRSAFHLCLALGRSCPGQESGFPPDPDRETG